MPENATPEPKTYPLTALMSGLLSAAAVLVYSLSDFTADHARARAFFDYSAFYCMALLCACWAFTLVRVLRGKDLRAFFSVNKWGLLAALALTTVIFVSVPPQLRILSDEANLVSVSKSMAMERRSLIITQAKFHSSLFQPVQRAWDKRPPLFSFCLSLLHTLTGYRMENAFALNFIFTAAFLGLLFCAVRPFLGVAAGFAAMLFTAAYPVFSLCAASGGFDLFSLLYLGVSLAALYAFLKNQAADEFAFLFMTLAFYSYTRYESGAVLLVLLALAACWKLLKPEYMKPSWLYFAAPLMFLPMLWQRFAVKLVEDSNYPTAFALYNVPLHLEELSRYFLDFSFRLPYAAALNLAFIAALATAAVFAASGRLRQLPQHQSRFLVCAAASLGALFTVWMLYHFMPLYSHPTSVRIFLPLCAAAALAPLWLSYFMPWLTPRVLLVLAAAVFLLYHPIAATNRWVSRLTLHRQTYYAYNYLEKNDCKNSLIITNRPVHYVIKDYGAVDFPAARKTSAELLDELHTRHYKDILVLQAVDFYSDKPEEKTDLPPEYALEPVYEMSFSTRQYLRISRVLTDAELALLKPEAKVQKHVKLVQ